MGQQDVKDETSSQAPASDQSADVSAAAELRQQLRDKDSEMQQLREKLAQKEDEARSNYDRFVRERAELENFKKRMQREKAEALRFACEPLVRELLPVVDNLERAVEHGDGNGASVLEGVRLVLKSIFDVLEHHGVTRIDAMDQPFDPTRHEAMAQVASAQHEPNRVVAQHHSGYLLHDRLLRPALVTVSGRKGEDGVENKRNSD